MSQPPKANQAAWDVGQMAQRMAEGYYTHLAVIQVAKDPGAVALSPGVEPGQLVSVFRVPHKDGTRHEFHFTRHLDQARSNPEMIADLDRVWLVGALLTLGDALGKQKYFDHAPELELVRHLRNGVAHGNIFRIKLEHLAKHPAHNRLAWVRSDSKAEFEITPALQNQPGVSPTNVRKVPRDSCQQPGRKGFSAIPELPRRDLV